VPLIVAAILTLVIVGWIIAVRALGKRFASIVGEKGREDIGESQSDPKPQDPDKVPQESKSMLSRKA